MTRLPTIGGDGDEWGVVLNEFLSQSLNSDGSLKDKALEDADVATKIYVDDSISNNLPDATDSKKGVIKLSNDLSGAADSPVARASFLKTATTSVAIGNASSPVAGQFLRASDGGNANWQAMPRSFGWYVEGVLFAGTAQGPIYELDAHVTILGFSINCKIAPATTGASFDVKVATSADGAFSSIFSSLPGIDAGALKGSGGTLAVTTLSAGEFIRLDIVQAGGTAAQGLTAQLKMETR
jgi:hypothetical protein